jgi:hypothetical protein
MSYTDWMFAERIMNLRVEDESTRTQSRRRASLLRKARSGGPSWRWRWMLCEVGYRLVALGAWLEGRLPANGHPIEGQAG